MTAAYDAGAANYPGASFQYVTVAGLPWGGTERSVFEGASPAVANGWTVVCSKLSSPDNFATTISSTGVVTIDSGGSIARQIITIDAYSPSLDAWMGLTLEYVNDVAPVALTTDAQSFTYTVGDNVSIDLSAYFFDLEGDELVYSLYSGSLPADLMISGSLVAGTVTEEFTGSVIFTATDIINQSGNSPTFNFTVNAGQILWPDLTGMTAEDAAALLDTLQLLIGTETQSESTETADTIIAQDPAAGTDAEVGDTVNITIAQAALGMHRPHHRGQRGRLTLPIVPQLTPAQQAVLNAREAAANLFNRVPTMQGPVLTPREAKVDALAKKMLMQ